MGKKKAVREPIATWWRIYNWPAWIGPVQVVAFTDSYATHLVKRLFDGSFLEVRVRRDDIFPTLAEAKAEAIRRLTRGIEGYERKLKIARKRIEDIKAMKGEL